MDSFACQPVVEMRGGGGGQGGGPLTWPLMLNLTVTADHKGRRGKLEHYIFQTVLEGLCTYIESTY